MLQGHHGKAEVTRIKSQKSLDAEDRSALRAKMRHDGADAIFAANCALASPTGAAFLRVEKREDDLSDDSSVTFESQRVSFEGLQSEWPNS